MRKKLTIRIDENVYHQLHRIIGRRRISRFIESLVRLHLVERQLDADYRLMAQEEAREAEALAWAEGTLWDPGEERARRIARNQGRRAHVRKPAKTSRRSGV